MPHRLTSALAILVLTALLAGCDGGIDPQPGPQSCTAAEQQRWLSAYLRKWYLWTANAPHPDPAAYADAARFFQRSLTDGHEAGVPADHWSNRQPQDRFDRFFDHGQMLGYGLSLAGLEVTGTPLQPLWVRQVEPLSPAAAQGVRRGDQVIAVNGRSAADLVAADDYAALSPAATGERLTLVLRRDGADRLLHLQSTVFELRPASAASISRTPGGRRIGYLAVKDMIEPTRAPLAAAFAHFKSQGIDDLVLDLRYNGGGLVEIGALLASYVVGSRAAGSTYAWLHFNERRAPINDQLVAFESPPNALGLTRVYVLTGRRTCSAAEQLINGLRGAGVEVVSIGETTCGKPVGFLPVNACGLTFSVVNFESLNQRSQGGYYQGFAPTCAVAEDFHAEPGSIADPLFAAATHHADTGSCPQRTPARFVGARLFDAGPMGGAAVH